MAEQASSVPADAVLALDRFVSASSAQDAVESLEAIVAGFKSKDEPWDQSWILENTEVVDHLTHLLQHGTLKNGDLPCGDEGINLVCQLYQTSLAKNSQSLKEPQPGQLLESLIDVMDSSDRQIYTRVLALQVLEQLSKNHSSLASSQWLQAPNGLHRLADMLSLGVDNPVEEVIRNQALIVAHFLAREAPISKVFLFAEVETKLLDLCWQQGGLTKGNSVVLDCLKLVEEMLKHTDANLQDLVWQRPSVPARLAQLIDLRGADEFLHPDEYKKKQKAKPTATVSDDDDLDSLLQSGDSKKQQSPKKEGQQDWFIPRLSSDEESIVDNVIRILHLLLEAENLRPTIWKAHAGLCSLVWELALVNPANPPVCAMPHAAIQQKALELVAMKFNDVETMDRHAGLDRLLFLVCTGGANAEAYKEKMATSQAALSVLRKTINIERAHELLLHTLAPPPEEAGTPAGPTVVEKLWNTVVENLSTSVTDEQNGETRSIFLSGALGGLSLLLCDEQSREMMSRVVPDAVNPDIMLESLQNEKNSAVQWTLLRFLCEWIMETPLMVQKLLNSSASTILAGMATDSKKDYTPLVHLLLGLAMEYLTGDEQDCGGWTRAGILQVIKKIGISKFTTSLEGLKKVQDCDLPCYLSPLERSHWDNWYSQAVWIVRKRVVDELTGGEPSSESDGEEPETSSTADAGSHKHLQKLLAQQAKEIESLRQEVENGRIRISSQQHQLETWKRRMESTPTELDGMLSEMTNKTATLEETIAKLESKAKEEKAAHEEELNKLNKQLAEVRQDVETSRAAEKEAVGGWERMEQELGALSQAYSSLEQDFQREKSNHAAALAAAASTTAATPAGESATQEQAHGERSEQRTSTGSLEVATLRAENDRLRNDARAADEWMKMAVDKMNEMGQNSAKLQQEAESLRDQVQSLENQDAVSKAANEKQLGEREQQLREQLSLLESQLQEEKALRATESGNAGQKTAQYEEEKRGMQEHISVLESQLQAQSEAMAANSKTAQEKYQQMEEKMNEEIMALEARLRQQNQSENAPSADTSQLQANHDAVVDELRQQIFNLEAQLEQHTSESFKESGPLEGEGHTSGATADKQLEAVRRELETSREHFDEDIYKKESRIRELEDRLKSGLGPYNIEDIRSRDEEIEELRAANEAAQEWMAKAVEHHQILAAQVASLSDEKVALAGKIENLEREHIASGPNDEAISTLQSQLQQKIELAEQVAAELAECKAGLTKMKEEREALEHCKQDLSIARDEIKSLQEKVQQLQSGNGGQEGDALRLENERLQESNKELQANLEQFTTWAGEAQKKIAEILAEKQAHETTIKDLKDSNSKLAKSEIALNENLVAKEMETSQLEATVIKKDELASELSSAKEKLEEVLNEERVGFNKLKDEVAFLTQQAQEAKSTTVELQKNLAASDAKRSELEGQLETLRAEKLALEKLLEDGKGKEGTFGEGKEMLDKKLASLEVAIEEELDEINNGEKTSNAEGTEEIAMLREELEAARDALDEDEDVVHQWEDRVAELESTIQSLESQLEEQEKEANDVVSQWQESYSESEEKCAALEKELAQFRSGMELLDAPQGNEMHDRVAQLQATIKSLESQLEEQEKEANDAVSQWEETYSESEAKYTALEKELETIRSGMDSPDDAMQDRVLELESTIESLKSQLQEQEKEANDAISQWQESYSESEEKCAALENELATVRSEMQSPDTIQDDAIQDRVLELESRVKSLESQLQEQEKEANDVVSQWQESYAAADEKCAELERELVTVRSEMESSAPQNDEMQARISELESSVQSLESQLKEQEQEASDVISQWQESYAGAEEKSTALEKELTTVRSEMESSGAIQSDAHDRISELENTVQSLQSQLEAQDNEANNVIAKWQERSSKAEDECAALEKELSAVRSEMNQAKASQDELVDQKAQIQELEGKITMLEGEIDTVNKAKQEQQKLSTEALSRLESDLLASNASYGEVNAELRKLQEESGSLKRLLGEKTSELEESNSRRESMESSRQTLEQENEAMRQQIQSNPPERVIELNDQLQQTQNDLVAAQEALRNDEEVVRQWEERAAELESTIAELESQLGDQESEANAVISEWQRQSSELEEQLTRLQDELNSSNEAIAERDATIESLRGLDNNNSSQKQAWLDDIEKLRGELRDEKKRTEEAKDEIEALSFALDEIRNDSSNSAQKLKDEIVGLNSTIESLRHDAEVREEESKNVTTLLESKIEEYEEIMSTLEADLDARNKALADLQSEKSQSKTPESKISEYEQKISALEEDLTTKTKALSDLKEAAQNDASESESRLAECEEKISALETDIESKIEAISNLKEDIVEKSEALSRQELELESLQGEIAKQRITIEGLENEIGSKTAEIEDLKQLGEESMTRTELVASRAENELLNEKLRSEQEARKLEFEKLETALAAETLKLQDARDEVEEIRKESEDVVNQWTARVDELEGTVTELELQLQQQEEDANVAISSWESKTLELEKELEASTEELDKLRESRPDQNIQAENTRLTALVAQLEEELREANSMIQTYVTNEAAEKATAVAASALRDEIDELQRTIDDYKQQIADEQSYREVAELEIERLRDDIATLAALTNHADTAEGLELHTVRAAEQLKKKDRIEIESLRSSLYRALNDVENAQTAERDAVNQLAKMQLATSIAEKDIVTAKSEIHFLSQALEESRLAEENRRASLEYRISSLEDDNDLLRKYHADELEEVRQELSQVTMEKDRAIHQIRELERSNAALVAAASKEDIYALDDQADLEHEIARLRVENEHLLTIAADDKARAERKLREMLAAQLASIEADTILEHELRVNAEETIVALKAQIEELRKASSGHTGGSGNDKEMSSSSASKQIKTLQEALDQATKEKKVLKQKLEREASKARASIEKLTEECRQAQSELHKTMRDNRYDQAVKSEVSKLHMSSSSSPPRRGRMPMTPESRDDVFWQTSILDTSVTSINAATFDQLRNYKEEMQEERKIYLELLAEHDDLLALLAQLDVEKNSLKDALAKVAGPQAVKEALKRAEEQTFEEHGGIIKLADDSDDDFAAVTDME